MVKWVLKTLKYYKARFVMYEDLEFLKEKIDEYKHNTENPNTTKVSKYTPSGFSISTIL